MYLNKESNSTSTLNMGIGACPHIRAMIGNVNCQPDRISKPCQMGTSVGKSSFLKDLILLFILCMHVFCIWVCAGDCRYQQSSYRQLGVTQHGCRQLNLGALHE